MRELIFGVVCGLLLGNSISIVDALFEMVLQWIECAKAKTIIKIGEYNVKIAKLQLDQQTIGEYQCSSAIGFVTDDCDTYEYIEQDDDFEDKKKDKVKSIDDYYKLNID